MFYLAQVIGFVGLICTAVSVQQTKKNQVLIYQVLANFLYFLQYFFLNAISAAGVSFLAIFRCIVFYNYEKRKINKSIISLIIFEMLAIILGIYSYVGILSLIPITTCIMYTYATWQDNLKIFRIIAFIVPVLFTIYNIYVGAYIGIISTIIELIAALIAIIKLDILKKELRN